jgi:hypothetical protein
MGVLLATYFGWLWAFSVDEQDMLKTFLCSYRTHLTLRCVIFHPQRVGIPENQIAHRMNSGIIFFEMPTLIFFLIVYWVGVTNKILKN